MFFVPTTQVFLVQVCVFLMSKNFLCFIFLSEDKVLKPHEIRYIFFRRKK
ncbi:unnamed protein product [Gulo gulo]|uniref:Uncharacterized protein n=1 Tax=Gulo gulo TaxID=48420 RepID=A0A9X9PT18_GULGU|nr:unnamed protein product [Gulo gulo]